MSIAASELEQHRTALTGHCYRMMGSSADADDAVQETLVRAWKSLDRFDGRSSLRTWLHRIATNVCLDMLNDRSRRARPFEEGPVGTTRDELVIKERTHWLEPVPDVKAIPADADPAEQLALRQSIRLAFVSALQHLPPKQRAALLLAEVVGWSAVEIAECLETTVASVNSALQRARATIASRDAAQGTGELSEKQKALLDRYVEAFLRYDVETLVSLLHDDAVMSMPPFALWLKGHPDIAAWLTGPGAGCRDSKLLKTRANGLPAFAQYRPAAMAHQNPTRTQALPKDGHVAWGLVVLELEGERIARWNTYLDVETLFPRFGLPMELPA